MPDDVSRRDFFVRTVTATGAALLIPAYLAGCEQVEEIKEKLGLGGGGDDDEDEDDGKEKGKGDGADGADGDGDGKKGKAGKGDGKKGKKGKDEKSAEEGDVEFLGKGILMEQSAINVYTAAAGLDYVKKAKDVLAVAGLFMGQHEQHRDALVALVKELGGTAPDPKEAKTPEIPKDVLDEKLKVAARIEALLRFARSRELDAAQNYFKAATEVLQTAPGRKLATNILPVEAQHVAVYDVFLKAEKPVGAALLTDLV